MQNLKIMKFFIETKESSIIYPESAILKYLESLTAEDDISIVFCDLINQMVVPTLQKIYQLGLSVTKQPFTLIPEKGEPFGADLEQKEIELTPFPFQQEDNVCVGGTFDHLHAGHKLLLTATALVARKTVIIGVSRKYNSKKDNANLVYPLHKRAGDVISFLFKINNNLIFHIESLDGFAGPAGRDVPMDALVLSIETKNGAEMVAQLRKEKNLPELKYYMIPLIMAPDGQNKISSTQIRKEEASHH